MKKTQRVFPDSVVRAAYDGRVLKFEMLPGGGKEGKTKEVEIPRWVAEVLADSRNGEMRTNADKENWMMLSQIAGEVEEFCEHEDCTTLQAVQLLKCKLRELEIHEKRRAIRSSWEG